MAKGDRNVKIVEWSDEDACAISSCPELFYVGCHGEDVRQVFAELCKLAEEAIETREHDGKPLPQPLSDREFVHLMLRSA